LVSNFLSDLCRLSCDAFAGPVLCQLLQLPQLSPKLRRRVVMGLNGGGFNRWWMEIFVASDWGSSKFHFLGVIFCGFSQWLHKNPIILVEMIFGGFLKWG
jgi:hypothetical protein